MNKTVIFSDWKKMKFKMEIYPFVYHRGITHTAFRSFKTIFSRFANTITGHFNGHTHRDQFWVYYDDDAHAVGVSWNGASITTYSDANPSYKLYQIDGETFVSDPRFMTSHVGVSGFSQCLPCSKRLPI